MIETAFDVPFVAEMALREKQIQQNYRPVIAVHKWFARRPGTLFRSLLLAEFTGGPLRERYFQANCLKGIKVADPFMGGGTPLLEANRLGCDVIGYDINPMAWWIVREEIEPIDLVTYRHAARKLTGQLEKSIGSLYKTKCGHCGSQNASVKYFLWVKMQSCHGCGDKVELFPGYLLAEKERHPSNVFICQRCGDLTETPDRKAPGHCRSCGNALAIAGPARRGFCTCPRCGTANTYPNPQSGPPEHRMFAIEYFCPRCKPGHQGRFFKKPDASDLERYQEAESRCARMATEFVPDDEIPRGDETDRLHRWGYRRYREMFNARQLLGLELSCQAIARTADDRIRSALATNLSDLLRYQNMLCRYDTRALKSLDIFSIHGYPVGLIQCESNMLGIVDTRQGTNVGSGGWSNIVDKYVKAKAYCEKPFEVKYVAGRKLQVPVPGEWIGVERNSTGVAERRSVELHCQSAGAQGLG
ncbi:MAG: DNA methylase, partial [Chloroflexi bacterium]|nr:DNA methylase [Chloroflexota bacterium]